MRMFAFILSLIVLSLSIVPCSDGMVDHDDLAISMHDHADHQAGHDHEDGESPEDCTPFCSCMCCGVQTTLPEFNVFEVTKATFSVDYFSHYSIHYDYSFSQGIWHPPATIS